jgi:hypothetical protein
MSRETEETIAALLVGDWDKIDETVRIVRVAPKRSFWK